MSIKLGHTEIFVKDPLKSKDFYVHFLGFEIMDIQADKYIWLKSGGREILLRPGDGAEKGSAYGSASSALVLYTDDLEKAKKELAAKGLEFKGNDGSEKCPVFTDEDGNWFQLVDPSEAH